MSLVKLCVDFSYFGFAGEEYQQISGLPMGYPLSAVMACLFLEELERDHYRDLIGRHSTCLRYVEDVFIIVTRWSCLYHTLTQLISIHEKIQFTVTEKEDKKLPLLDTDPSTTAYVSLCTESLQIRQILFTITPPTAIKKIAEH